MASKLSQRPAPSEFAPHAKLYVDQVPEGDLLELLGQQIGKTLALFAQVNEDRASEFRYAPGKWTIKETLGHMSDTERILSYRALRIARGDQTPLPGFEQDPYVETAHSNDSKLQDLLSEFRTVRSATLSLFQGLRDEVWERRGNVSGSDVTARGMAFTLAGHEIHHLKIFQERYLL